MRVSSGDRWMIPGLPLRFPSPVYTSPVSADQLASVLRRIAGAVSSSLDLKEVFGRVAEATAEVIPFDAMTVTRHDREGVFEIHSLVGTVKGPPLETSIEEFSPAVMEFFVAGGRTNDFESLLDVAFPQDRLFRADRFR